MKRVGGLIESIADFDNLALAFCNATRGKTAKADVARFRARLDAELADLRQTVLAGTAQFGPYRQLEQQRQQLPVGEPEQQLAGQHEQQHRVPSGLAPSSPCAMDLAQADPDEVLSAHGTLA